MRDYIVLIPARGGSKGIPGKNLRPVAGKPLVAWTVEAAASCPAVTRVYVSTDDEAIGHAVEALALERVTVVDRAAETATDTASTESVIADFLARHRPPPAAGAPDPGHLILMQATSPLTTSRDLREAIRHYEQTGADSLVTVCRQKRFVWQKDGECVTPINYDPARRPRRQDFPGFLVENGAFYLAGMDGLRRAGCRLHGRVAAYEMAPETYLEIDEPEDLALVEQLLRTREETRSRSRITDRLAAVRLVILDVDGVLTDGAMYYDAHGEVLKRFDTRDGMGIARLREAGLHVALVTGEDSSIAFARARKLGLTEVHLGVDRKLPCVDAIRRRHGLTWDEVAAMGDDRNDLEVLRSAGLSAAPADAQPEVRRATHLVTRAGGGHGAVRELAERILAARVPAEIHPDPGSTASPVSGAGQTDSRAAVPADHGPAGTTSRPAAAPAVHSVSSSSA